jgi:hypothetical protein
LATLVSDPITQLGETTRSIAVPVDFAVVGKFTQRVFPGGDADAPFETQAFQFQDTEGGHI